MTFITNILHFIFWIILIIIDIICILKQWTDKPTWNYSFLFFTAFLIYVLHLNFNVVWNEFWLEKFFLLLNQNLSLQLLTSFYGNQYVYCIFHSIWRRVVQFLENVCHTIHDISIFTTYHFGKKRVFPFWYKGILAWI